MLDNSIQRIFIKESIKKKLGISGRKTDITIKTLNGKQNMESTMMTGLKVSKSWRTFSNVFVTEREISETSKQ